LLFGGAFCIPNRKICGFPVHIGSFRKRCDAGGGPMTMNFVPHFDLVRENYEALDSARGSF
jgi:hypothetical protein